MNDLSLGGKARSIIDNSDFNDLPYDERVRIAKYTQEMQILTIIQMLNKDKELTTEAWRRKQRNWLENCVRSYEEEYGK
jgi:hypothetical protein